MKYKILVFLLLFVLAACQKQVKFDAETIKIAQKNGQLANEGYVRSYAFTKAWLKRTDPLSGLIPSNLDKKSDLWEPHNSAADNYPFMVLTAYLLDEDLYQGQMLELLNAEKKLTSRVKSLPDTYSFSKRGFKNDELKMGEVIFGTSEYIKDGLIPLNEYIGKSPWQDRMMEMLDDLSEHVVNIDGSVSFGDYRAATEEVNGEMLQTLARIYWMTGDKKYLDWAIKIGDYYMLGERNLCELEYLRIRDHGCEIIGGLSELYVLLHFKDGERKKAYQPALYKLLDLVLKNGRNDDGIFYNAINPKTGEVVDKNIVDNWGYVFDAYYSVWMVDKKEEYRQAVLNGFRNLYDNYRNYAWEGQSHDGYADALESGINLYNREQVPELKKWIDSEITVMYNMQQENGIIGGWHGDGNFARTAIMYSLWKTLGAHVNPWREDVCLGAEKLRNVNYFVLSAKNAWEGRITFDTPRHKNILNLPIDYPRINQFPEWFTIDTNKSYKVNSTHKAISGLYSGEELLKGINVKTGAGEQLIITLQLAE